MDLIQSSTFYSSTVTLVELLERVKKQVELFQDLGTPWKVKLTPILNTEHSYNANLVSGSSSYLPEREFEKLLQIMQGNEKKFEKIINNQDLQIVQIQSASNIAQDTIHKIYQLQRNEDELRYKSEIAMQQIEISTLRRKLMETEKMLSAKGDKDTEESDKEGEEISLDILARRLKVVQWMIEIRDAELVAIREHLRNINHTSLVDSTIRLEEDIELQKGQFQDLFNSTLYGTRLLQSTLSEIQPADQIRNNYTAMKNDSSISGKDLPKQSATMNLRRPQPCVQRLGSLANDLLTTLHEDTASIDDEIKEDTMEFEVTLPDPVNVIPAPSSVVPITHNSTLLKRKAIEGRRSNDYPVDYLSTLLQPSTPPASVVIENVVKRDKLPSTPPTSIVTENTEKRNKLPSISSLIPEHALGNRSESSLSPTTIAPYNYLAENLTSLPTPRTTYDSLTENISSPYNSPKENTPARDTPYNLLAENTSSLDLLSSVCPPPIPTPSNFRQQDEEEPFLSNKLPPIRIPKSKLIIPTTTTTLNTNNKRPTGMINSDKVEDAFNNPFFNKRLRTFVTFKPDKMNYEE